MPVTPPEPHSESLPPPSPQTLVAAVKAALRSSGDTLDARVEEALLHVPRAAFLPDAPPEQAYADRAIAVQSDSSGLLSSASQPTMIALMLRMLRLKPGMNVLEIGSGTGYNAALMAHIVGPRGRVTSVEIDPHLAETARANLQRIGQSSAVTVVTADGWAGFAPRASYDRIIATVGIYDIPSAWVKQLKPGGVLVAPVWLEAAQVCAEFHLQADGTLYAERSTACSFVRLRGPGGGREVTTRIGGGALVMHYTRPPIIDPAGLHALLSEGGENVPIENPFTGWELFTSLLPYLSLYPPDGVTVTHYQTADRQRPYGIESEGIALIGRGAAGFVWAPRLALMFGAADVSVMWTECLAAWERDGRPGLRQLRLRAAPLETAEGRTGRGRRWVRRDHVLDAWFV
jgi:protein-L-isoaspartate(D-aspartate) O-methyltransferase